MKRKVFAKNVQFKANPKNNESRSLVNLSKTCSGLAVLALICSVVTVIGEFTLHNVRKVKSVAQNKKGEQMNYKISKKWKENTEKPYKPKK